MQAVISRANRQNVGKVSPENARDSTKGFIFKAFCVFSNRLHGRLKKETVNLSFKNAILCLDCEQKRSVLHFGTDLFQN